MLKYGTLTKTIKNIIKSHTLKTDLNARSKPNTKILNPTKASFLETLRVRDYSSTDSPVQTKGRLPVCLGS